MKTSMWNEENRLWDALGKESPGTEKYDKIQEEIVKNMEMQGTLLERTTPLYVKVLTNPVLIAGCVQLVATVVVVNHEQVGIITSKAFNWIRLGR